MFRSSLLQSTRLSRTPFRAPQAAFRFARPLTTSRIAFHPSASSPASAEHKPYADPQHATGTAKQEVKNIARDLAGIIGAGSANAANLKALAADAAAGARENVHAQGTIEQDFVSNGFRGDEDRRDK
jgi:hypothetical protein